MLLACGHSHCAGGWDRMSTCAALSHSAVPTVNWCRSWTLRSKTPLAGAAPGWCVAQAVLSAALGCSLSRNWTPSGYKTVWLNWSSRIPSGRSGCASAPVLQYAAYALAFRETHPQEYSTRIGKDFEDFANDEPCPVLDPKTGTCDLYTARPDDMPRLRTTATPRKAASVFANFASMVRPRNRSPRANSTQTLTISKQSFSRGRKLLPGRVVTPSLRLFLVARKLSSSISLAVSGTLKSRGASN